MAPAFANSPTSSLDQHGDVSRDGQVTLSKQVTLKHCRDDDSCTLNNVHLDPQVRADAAAAKSDSEKDHGIDFAYDPFFIEDLKGSYMDAGEIGQANQPAGSLHHQDNGITVTSAVSLK